MKEFLKEFKSFAVKGNLFELGVAVLVGNAFSAVLNSFIGEILGPFIALATNSVDFKTLSYTLRPDLVIHYGTFLQSIFNFLIIALSIFIILKLLQLLKRK